MPDTNSSQKRQQIKVGTKLGCFGVNSSTFKGCFMNITSGGGGIIKSPNYPRKYLINSTCEWNIQARYPQGRILLEFPVFSIEGNYKLSE